MRTKAVSPPVRPSPASFPTPQLHPPQLQPPGPPLLPPSADQRHVQIEVSRPCTLSGGTGGSGDTSPRLVLPAVAGAWGRRRVGGRAARWGLLHGHAGSRDEDPLPSSPGGPSSPSSPGGPSPHRVRWKRSADGRRLQTRSSNSAGVAGGWRGLPCPVAGGCGPPLAPPPPRRAGCDALPSRCPHQKSVLLLRALGGGRSMQPDESLARPLHPSDRVTRPSEGTAGIANPPPTNPPATRPWRGGGRDAANDSPCVRELQAGRLGPYRSTLPASFPTGTLKPCRKTTLPPAGVVHAAHPTTAGATSGSAVEGLVPGLHHTRGLAAA